MPSSPRSPWGVAASPRLQCVRACVRACMRACMRMSVRKSAKCTCVRACERAHACVRRHVASILYSDPM